MTTKVGIYVKDNIFGMVITVMLSLFIWQYQQDRTEAKEFRTDILKSVNRINDRQLVVAHILYYDNDTAPEWKTMLMEWLKIETRGEAILNKKPTLKRYNYELPNFFTRIRRGAGASPYGLLELVHRQRAFRLEG